VSPQRNPSPCLHPGCPHLVSQGRCPVHQREHEKQDVLRRGTATQRGYGPRWQADSRAYRQKHPICQQCQNPSELVDHITPVEGPADPLFWDRKNWQALCRSCHAVKTLQQGGAVNRALRVQQPRWPSGPPPTPEMEADAGAWFR
jgi:5-methylcytosine-specific restriction protein A